MDLNNLLRSVVDADASDVHLKLGRPPIVRFDGELEPLEGWPALDPAGLAEVLALVGASSRSRLAAFEETGELDTAYQADGLPRFRVNAFRQRGEISFAFRVIPNEIPDFESLGLPAGVQRLSEEHRGLILVTGATGVGKTTTLAAMLAHINRTRRQHVVTIEDPIEFLHEDDQCIVNQREVGIDTGSFHEALRRVLRQDPDVILIGELRDRETAETALQAAESGHLVLSTMHTLDAAETLGRMVEFFPAGKQPQVRSILAGVLKGVISQRLLPRAGGGRVAAVEVMVANARVQELIRENRPEEVQEAIADGAFFQMQTLTQALIDLVVAGEVERRDRGRRRNQPARLHDPARPRAHAEGGRGRPGRSRGLRRGRPGRVRRSQQPARGLMGLTLAAVALLPGLAFGSFLNVLAARIPLRRSVVSPGSACMACAIPLAWYDNLPLLSFAFLRGRCRHCRTAIPWRYPLVEATTGLLIAGCVLRFGVTWDAAVASFLCAALVAVSATDFERRIIPNRIVLPATAVVLAANTLLHPSVEWAAAGLGAALFLLLAALAYPGGMGMGDVKLALLLGVALGRTVPVALMVGTISALVPAAVLFARHGSAARKMKIPFGPFLALGAVVALFAGPALLDAYLGLLS